MRLRTAKWLCVAATAAAALLVVASGFVELRIGLGQRRGVIISYGLFVIGTGPGARTFTGSFQAIPLKGPGWRWSLYRASTWPSSPDNGGPINFTSLALWPLTLAAIPAILLWRRDATARRRERGLCTSCGYDLSGLRAAGGGATPPCPECGTTDNPAP